jgi:F-type H+-transporting ATPase subunit delta
MKNVRVARRYAAALMAAALPAHAVERTAEDLAQVAGVIRTSRELRLLLASPVVPAAKKSAVLRALFVVRIAPLTMGCLELVTAKSREAHLTEIIEQFNILRDEQLGIVRVHVTSAIEVTPSQESGLVRALAQYTRKDVRVHVTLDKGIKGGLVVRIGDTVHDASIRRQLEKLGERLRAGSPLSN